MTSFLRHTLISAVIAVTASALAFGQTPETVKKPSVISGDVVSMTDRAVVIKTATGDVNVVLSDATKFMRVSPENPSLKTATAAQLSDVGVGDKLTVTGVLADDGKSVPARAVYLMTKSEIAQKQSRESEQWRTRGITGKVARVDPQTNQITVEMRGLGGSSSIVLTPKDNAKFLRYAPDSVRFDEAKASSISDVKPGDMIRALGDRGTDGATFAAEQIVTGAFQTLVGAVKSVDAAANEIVIRDIQTNKDVTVLVSSTSVLKRFPPEIAERMSGRPGIAPGGARGQGVRPPAAEGTAGPPRAEGTAGPPRGAGANAGQRGGIDDMIERFPTITAADLKAGDMIAISSTKNAVNDRIKAIKLLAGVEPFLRGAPAAGGAPQRGGQGVQSGFSIPGLDGIGFP